MANKAKTKSKTRKKGSKNNNLMMWVFGVLCLLIVLAIVVVLVLNNANPNLNEDFFMSDSSKYVVSADLESFGDERIVSAYDVYYHDGDNITGHKAYYEFADEETAQAVLGSYQSLEDEEIDTVELNGRFIILIANPVQYEGLTLEMLKQLFEASDKNDEIDDAGVEEGMIDEGENIDTESSVDTVEVVEETEMVAD